MENSVRAPSPCVAESARMEWTSERQDLLEQMAETGCTALDVARVLKCSRSAVLGRAHRLGVTFHGKPGRQKKVRPQKAPSQRGRRISDERRELVRKRYLDGAPVDEIAAEARCSIASIRAFVQDLPRRHAWDTYKRYDQTFKITAVALVLSGYGFLKAHRRLGVSSRTLQVWRDDPVIAAAATPIAAQVRAEEAVKRLQREEVRRVLQAEADAERARIAAEIGAHNASILPTLRPRVRTVIEARLIGETLQQIGDRLGVTRERVRQLETYGRRAGIRFVDDRRKPVELIGQDVAASAGTAERAFARAHAELDRSKPRRAYTITEEERERRRERGRMLARRRWGSVEAAA